MNMMTRTNQKAPKMRQHTVSRAWLWRLGSPWFGFLPSSKRKCCRGTGRNQAGSARCRPAARGSPWRSSPAPPAPPRRSPRPPPTRPWGPAGGRPARPQGLGGGAEGRGHGAESRRRAMAPAVGEQDVGGVFARRAGEEVAAGTMMGLLFSGRVERGYR